MAIVGSGFAGSILARILTRQGHEVRLLERAAHPRFALGESSTPLAAICLERLAARYGLDDLHQLAAYGRWLRHIPHVRRGLKRGFTFYAHRPGERFQNDPGNANRLLVAASPHDAVADSHWLRADVDHFLVCQAESEGVSYQDRVTLTGVERCGAGLRLLGERLGRRLALDADVVLDASGPNGFLARHLPIRSRLDQVRLRTGLVFGHFEAARGFEEVASAVGAEFPVGPYPDERAAIHHTLEEGWMYVLPFDHGVMSAGFVVEHGAAWRAIADLTPEVAWRFLLGRYPTLDTQFAAAQPMRPVGTVPRLQWRLERAAGPNWALLPHAFCFMSPLFSTGIAWSLLGVERLALVLEPLAETGPDAALLEAGLMRYGALLNTEADHLVRLIEGAYRARGDFDVFAAYSYLYFAAVSYAEAAQRLLPPPAQTGAWAWEGFLGSTDPTIGEAVSRASALLESNSSGDALDFGVRYFETVRELIAPRNVAGLADPDRQRLYPVDFETLVASAPLLGLNPEDVRRALPGLRGG